MNPNNPQYAKITRRIRKCERRIANGKNVKDEQKRLERLTKILENSNGHESRVA